MEAAVSYQRPVGCIYLYVAININNSDTVHIYHRFLECSFTQEEVQEKEVFSKIMKTTKGKFIGHPAIMDNDLHIVRLSVLYTLLYSTNYLFILH